MAIRTPVPVGPRQRHCSPRSSSPAPIGPSAAQGRDVVVFAAASLKNALDEIATAWTRESGGKKATIGYAASSVLAKQIEQGAPADLFASADLDWMDDAQSKGLVLARGCICSATGLCSSHPRPRASRSQWRLASTSVRRGCACPGG